jgi:hypothetical protein
MYVSGHLGNFQVRLHQLPTGQVDLNSFNIEGHNYTGLVSGYQITRWNREYARRQYAMTRNGTFLTGKVFNYTTSLGPGNAPTITDLTVFNNNSNGTITLSFTKMPLVTVRMYSGVTGSALIAWYDTAVSPSSGYTVPNYNPLSGYSRFFKTTTRGDGVTYATTEIDSNVYRYDWIPS